MARCVRPNIEVSQPSLLTSCSISSPTISCAYPGSLPPEGRACLQYINPAQRHTANSAKRRENSLARFFSKLLECPSALTEPAPPGVDRQLPRGDEIFLDHLAH